MRSGHIVARNSLWLVTQSLAMNVVSVLVVAMVARYLGPSDYGRLVLFLAVVAFMSPFVNLGLRQYMVREIAGRHERAQELMCEIIPLRLILALATTVVGAFVYAALFGVTTLSLVAWFCIGLQLLLSAMNGSFIDTMYGLERIRHASMAMFVSGMFIQSVLLAAVLLGLSLDFFIGAYVLGSAVLWWRLRVAVGPRYLGLRWHLAVHQMGKHLRGCWRFGVPLLLETTRTRTSHLLIGGVLGPAPLGQYGAPSTLLEKLDVIQDGVGTALYPRAVSLHHNDRAEMIRLVRSTSRFLLMVSSAISVGAIFAGEAVVELIFGAAYREAGPLFVMMAAALPFSFLYAVMFNVLNATDNQHKVTYLSLFSTVSSLILLGLLVSTMGLLGAVLAYTATYIMLCAAFMWVYWKQFGALLEMRDLVKIIVANGVMALALWLLPGINVIWQIAVGAAVFGACAFILRLVSADEFAVLFSRKQVAP